MGAWYDSGAFGPRAGLLVAFVVVEIKAIKPAAEVGQPPVWAVKGGFLEHQKCND